MIIVLLIADQMFYRTRDSLFSSNLPSVFQTGYVSNMCSRKINEKIYLKENFRDETPKNPF